MKTTSIIGIIVFILTSCETKYEYWNLSKFNMNNESLEDNEEVKIIYTSRGPDSNKELKYYIHLIAVSQKTGDTVNILTTADNGLTLKDEDKIFNFFNKDNLMTKLTQSDLENLINVDLEKVKNKELKKIDKVARDPEFDHITDNSYPTIIGTIGTTQSNNQ